MKKLYEKNEITFSLVWIGLYIIVFSVADSISENLGTAKIITAPVAVIMTILIAVFINKNGLTEKYGLGKVNINLGKYLYFIPLIILASTNLWNGFAVNSPVLESILHVISMLCVGFIEEIVFRGFLFKAMCKSNIKRAVIVSSVTFGIGHIVNLLNGADTFSTILQICYAVAIGFLFTIIFYRSGSLLPCIITHGILNSLSAFSSEMTNTSIMISSVILIVVSLLYAVFIIAKTKDSQ